MTGHENVLEEFAPLSFECVKGAAISLGIGALLYVCFIRRVLMKDGVYADLWPQALDLENLLYRPLLTKWLPGCFGAILSVPAENQILTVVSHALVKGAGMAVRILAVSTDAMVVLVRRTVLKESIFARVRKKIGFWNRRRLTLEKAYEPITGNFSFALMASCIGMMVIFAVVMYFNLRS